jgi:hypothetical protein
LRAVFGFYEETGTNNTYIGNNVIPYPYPVGSGGMQQAPLQSSLADGFHAGSAFEGPTLIGNTFIQTGDDGIAIHGHYYLVVGVRPRPAHSLNLAVRASLEIGRWNKPGGTCTVRCRQGLLPCAMLRSFTAQAAGCHSRWLPRCSKYA